MMLLDLIELLHSPRWPSRVRLSCKRLTQNGDPANFLQNTSLLSTPPEREINDCMNDMI